MEYKLFDYPEKYKNEIIDHHKKLVGYLTNSTIKNDNEVINTDFDFKLEGSVPMYINKNTDFYKKLRSLLSTYILIEESVSKKNDNSINNLVKLIEKVYLAENEKDISKKLELLKSLQTDLKEDKGEFKKDFYQDEDFRKNTLFGKKRRAAYLLSDRTKKQITKISNDILSELNEIINSTEKENSKEKEKKVEQLSQKVENLEEENQKISLEANRQIEEIKKNYEEILDKLKKITTEQKENENTKLLENATAELLKKQEEIKKINDVLNEFESITQQYIDTVKDETEKKKTKTVMEEMKNKASAAIKNIKSGKGTSEDIRQITEFLKSTKDYLKSLGRMELAFVIFSLIASIIISVATGGLITYIGKLIFDFAKNRDKDKKVNVSQLKSINETLKKLNENIK